MEFSTFLLDIKTLVSTHGTDYILIDYPFSRLHDELIDDIDLTVFIDTPLDIALCRRLIRDKIDKETEEIIQDVRHYLHNGRNAYLSMLRTVKPNSDVIIDGTLSINEIVIELNEVIMRLRK